MKKCKIKDVIEKEFKGLWGTDFDNNGIPVIKTNNMTYEGRINFSDICYRNISLDDAKENLLQKGDLIIEKSGGTKTHSVGYVNIFEGIDNKFVCNNFILPIRPKKDLVIPKFLFWQLHSMYKTERFSDCFNKTTGIQNLQKKTYFDKEIYLYDISIQKQIANHLDTIQAAIDNKQQQLKELDELVKSRFIEMFGDQKENFKRFYLSEAATKIFAGGDRPEDTSDFQTEDYPYPVFANAETNKGLLCFSKTFQVDTECVTIAARGCTVGYTEVRNQKFTPVVRLITIIPKEDIKALFLKYYLDLELKIEGNGAAQPQLTVPNVKLYKIYIPPLSLQNDFVSFVQQIDKSKFVVISTKNYKFMILYK